MTTDHQRKVARENETLIILKPPSRNSSAIWKKKKRKQKYQIEKRSKTPTASPIVTFLRRPPIQSCTHKISISSSNHSFVINGHSPFQSSISSYSHSGTENEAEACKVKAKAETQKLNPRTHFQNQPKYRSLSEFMHQRATRKPWE